MKTIYAKNTDNNFNEKVNSSFESYKEKGGELTLKISNGLFELLMIAAKEGLNSFKQEAEKRNMKSILETIIQLESMRKDLQKLAEESETTIKFEK